jgi:hypothetical protein
MSIRTEEATTPANHHPMAASDFSQRKCACGGTSGLSGSCSSCKSSEVAVPQRSSMVSGAEHSPAHEDGELANHSSSGHDFSRIPVHRSSSAGRFSIQVSPTSAPSSGQQTEISDEDPMEQTSTSASTTGNRINVTFDPTTSSPTPHCGRIILTQWIQMTADGSPIMPGTYRSAWTCRDPTCLSDSTYLDHGKCSYTTPYPVDRGIGSAGSSNGTAASATYSDAPSTGGGDLGFNSAANPTGWNTVTYLFGNYAFCAEGTDCGTWYDGVEWNYTKTAADHAAGRNGTATATASALPPAPGATIIQAFDKYNTEKGFTPCMYSTIGP